MASNRWVLTDVVKTPGKNGVTCVRVRWHGVEEGETLETTTDSTMRNFNQQGWRELSEDARPWGIYSNIHPSTRATTRGINVASADYRPVLEDRIDTKAGADWIVAELRKPSAGTSSTWDDIFTED